MLVMPEVSVLLTGYVEVARLFQQQVQVREVLGYEEPRVAHEIQDVAEHTPIPINEVMLLQGV